MKFIYKFKQFKIYIYKKCKVCWCVALLMCTDMKPLGHKQERTTAFIHQAFILISSAIHEEREGQECSLASSCHFWINHLCYSNRHLVQMHSHGLCVSCRESFIGVWTSYSFLSSFVDKHIPYMIKHPRGWTISGLNIRYLALD